jgi:hypothetical protein
MKNIGYLIKLRNGTAAGWIEVKSVQKCLVSILGRIPMYP